MSRRIVGELDFAGPCLRPPFIRPARAGVGAKGAGVRYERLLAKQLRRAVHGQWFHFIEDGEPGWCQPDLLIVGRKRVLVVEVKLTFTPEAHYQLDYLYRPVLAKAYGKPVLAIVACKNLVSWMPEETIVGSFSEAVELADRPKAPILHWLGRGPI